ncbi:class I SAM-dependent methyltransferase [Brevundimonas sp. NPDC046655]|uniref:class I SAM-dependent methyltransferase n=1 Tax=unclassified Brevundimonas TaxID=2622653 RepID=UPI00384B2D01
MDWTAGYVADIGYSSQYYPELNPARLPIALLNAGYAPPRIRTACELGFGQGVSVNMHAAAQPNVEWYGNDFNPSHAAFAAGLAEAAGSKAQLTDESFAEFFARDDLPDFDYIGLHGVWSWISDENRALIVDFIRRKLRVGGVVYISYNTLPGWAAAMPLRQLMAEHATTLSAPGLATEDKVEAALAHVEALLAVEPAYLASNPQVAQRFAQMKGLDRRYLAHEYFNRDWKPMYFSEVADMLSAAKLSFACSANYSDMLDEIWMTPEQKALIDAAPTDLLTQGVRDFIVNQQFRKDIWIKGGETPSPRSRMQMLTEQRIALVAPVESVTMAIELNGRQITLQEEVYRPILDILSDHRPHTIGEIQAAVTPVGVAPLQVLQAVIVLLAANFIAAAQTSATEEAARAGAARMNAAILARVRQGEELPYAASAVVGGAIIMDRVTQLIADAVERGAVAAEAVAEEVWSILNAEGRVVLKDGQAIETIEGNKAELYARAEVFLKEKSPLLQAVGATFAISSPKARHKK